MNSTKFVLAWGFYCLSEHSAVFNRIYINMQSLGSLLHTSDLRANTLWHENRALVHGYTNPGRQNFCTVGLTILGNSRTIPIPPNSTPTVVSMYASHGCYSDVWVLR